MDPFQLPLAPEALVEDERRRSAMIGCERQIRVGDAGGTTAEVRGMSGKP